ncbi:MAG: RsmB/NOP family class I SAM-dependent RNA methyltransferase [Alphaproteobacteria bacterium]
MTPGARSQTAIELLDDLPPGRPADRFLSGYFRSHRFIGAKDRREIADLVFGIFRRRAQLDWWIAEGAAGASEPGNRARVLAARALLDGWDEEAIASAFDGGKYRPEALSGDERGLVARLATGGALLDEPSQPDPTRYNYPEWLDPQLRQSLAGELEAEMAALLEPASLDLRVNRLKATREEVSSLLAGEGIEAAQTPWSPDGLRLKARRTLPSLKAFSEGLIEVQDEGAQLASRLVDARPGHCVVDYCAGAGGKALAMAATMRGRGQIFACDTSAGRLARLGPRLERAGIHGLVQGSLLDDEDFAEALPVGAVDRVLLDVPCSGIGTWRRNPDARWRLTPEYLALDVARQRHILGRAASLPSIGGRLVYVTCSVLRAENEEQIDWFLQSHTGYTQLSAGIVWGETVGGEPPRAEAGLRLSSAGYGTDGFFIAILERRR